MPPTAAARERALLERHVIATQRSVRSCTGCGLCCTSRFNAVHILPIEGRRIAAWVAARPTAERDGWIARLRGAVAKVPRLARSKAGVFYTCPFLEPDFRCALPLDVKPVACLAFNPLTPERCDQEPDRYHSAHAPLAAENRALGLVDRLRSIPAAVLEQFSILVRGSRTRS